MEVFIVVVLMVIAVFEIIGIKQRNDIRKQSFDEYIDHCYDIDLLKEMIKRQNKMPIDMTEIHGERRDVDDGK